MPTNVKLMLKPSGVKIIFSISVIIIGCFVFFCIKIFKSSPSEILAFLIFFIAGISLAWYYQKQKFKGKDQTVKQDGSLNDIFDQFFVNSIDMLCIADTNGYFVKLNPEWEVTLGYTLPELEGKKFIEFVHPEDVEKTIYATSQLANNLKIGNFTNRYRHKDGSYRWIEWRSFPSGAFIYASARDITDKKKAEQELLQNDLWLRESQRNSHIGSYNFNVQTGIWKSSEELDAIFGIPFDYDKTIQGWVKLIHPDHKEEMYMHLSKHVIEQHNPFNKEYRIIRQDDGEVRWVHGLGNLYFDDAGNVLQMIGTIQDITHLKKSEEKLKRSEEKYRKLFEVMIDGFALHELVYDSNGKAVDWIYKDVNSKYKELWGVTDEIIGKSVFEAFSSLAEQSWIDMASQVVTTKEPVTVYNWMPDKKKFIETTEFWFEEKTFGALFRDITLEHVTQEKLKQSEKKYRLLFENMTSGFALHEMIYDENGKPKDYRYIEANPAFEKLTGLKIGAIIGKTIKEILPEIEEHWIQTYGVVALTGEPTSYTNYAKDLGRYYETYVFSPEKDKFAVVFNDITERKQYENTIRSLNESLEKKVEERTKQLLQANNDLEAFTYSVSHDLRAPLRHIDGFTKLLYSSIPNPSETTVNYFSKIEFSAKRMSSIIDDLLTFSRLGRKEINISSVNLFLLIHEIIEQFKPDIINRTVNWKIDELPEIKGDKNLLRMAFENLISNALKYTSKKEKAFIQIGVSNKDENCVEIYIKDNGQGFDMAYSDKLFGVFQRLHASEEFEGTGIGLANVKQIIQKHKGSIRAEGKVNEGATFYISIPN
jgi:PAS domain S-box-containing protein